MARRIPLERPPSPSDKEKLKRLQDAVRLSIGGNIRRARNEAGLSLRQLGIRADLSPTYLSEIERGKRAFAIDILVSVSLALGMRISDILSDD